MFKFPLVTPIFLDFNNLNHARFFSNMSERKWLPIFKTYFYLIVSGERFRAINVPLFWIGIRIV